MRQSYCSPSRPGPEGNPHVLETQVCTAMPGSFFALLIVKMNHMAET